MDRKTFSSAQIVINLCESEILIGQLKSIGQ
jgi:hypothetical protein